MKYERKLVGRLSHERTYELAKSELSYDKWLQLITLYWKYVMANILTGVGMQTQLGYIKMVKRKPKKGLGVDMGKTTRMVMEKHNLTWNEAKQYISENKDKVIFYNRNNSHMKGFKIYLFWHIGKLRIKNIAYWRMELLTGKPYSNIMNYFKNDSLRINKIDHVL